MVLIFCCVEIIFTIIIKTAKTKTTIYVVIKSATSYLFQLKRTYDILLNVCFSPPYAYNRRTVCSDMM